MRRDHIRTKTIRKILLLLSACLVPSWSLAVGRVDSSRQFAFMPLILNVTQIAGKKGIGSCQDGRWLPDRRQFFQNAPRNQCWATRLFSTSERDSHAVPAR